MLRVTHQQQADSMRSLKVVPLRVVVQTVVLRILALTRRHLVGSVGHLLPSAVARVTLILLVLQGLDRQI